MIKKTKLDDKLFSVYLSSLAPENRDSVILNRFYQEKAKNESSKNLAIEKNAMVSHSVTEANYTATDADYLNAVSNFVYYQLDPSKPTEIVEWTPVQHFLSWWHVTSTETVSMNIHKRSITDITHNGSSISGFGSFTVTWSETIAMSHFGTKSGIVSVYGKLSSSGFTSTKDVGSVIALNILDIVIE